MRKHSKRKDPETLAALQEIDRSIRKAQGQLDHAALLTDEPDARLVEAADLIDTAAQLVGLARESAYSEYDNARDA